MSKIEFEIGRIFDPAFAQLRGKELKTNLEGVSVKTEEGEYTKTLTNEELGIAKSQFSDVSIKLAKISDKKKEAVAEFKAQETEPKKQAKELLDMIKTNTVRKQGLLYLVPDYEKGFMYKFDEKGICVTARPLSPEERQFSIVDDSVRRLDASGEN